MKIEYSMKTITNKIRSSLYYIYYFTAPFWMELKPLHLQNKTGDGRKPIDQPPQ
jgi:hypothetical protein